MFVRLRAASLLLPALVLHGCLQPDALPDREFAVSGYLQDERVLEASGLARSNRTPGLLWVVNDNGAEADLHASNPEGANLGTRRLGGARNVDWEDLASFMLNGSPYLLVADIGDNEAQHAQRTLYILEEPAPDGAASTAWQVRYRYPDGARDAESAAVDSSNERVLVLSKRDRPPRLYALPLRPTDELVQEATLLGELTSLPAPSATDVARAPETDNWWWQPVAMDISADNRAAVILTYVAVYYFKRESGQDWYDALQSRPLRVELIDIENAEAVAFADDGRTVIVTGESRHSPLLRLDFEGARVP